MQQFTASPPRRAGHVATRATFSHRLGRDESLRPGLRKSAPWRARLGGYEGNILTILLRADGRHD
jgi:hypothetical protein